MSWYKVSVVKGRVQRREKVRASRFEDFGLYGLWGLQGLGLGVLNPKP